MNFILQSIICPITQEIMTEPVIDNEGNSYEKKAIYDWLENNNTSPITRNYLDITHLKLNRALLDIIDLYKNESNLEEISSNTTNCVNFEEINIKSHYDGIKHILEINIPESTIREPVDIACILDVSGSMNTIAKLPDNNEQTDLTILDLSVHAIKTIVKNMNDKDNFVFITFSDIISDKLNGYKQMNEINKNNIITQIESLTAGGTTNLWGGLKKGIEQLSQIPSNNNKHCILFTDGVPNVHPPRPYNQMVKKYITEKYPDYNIHTIGFGYNINSNILDDDISRLTNGFYSYIPDAGFIGTVILNLMSNIYTCCGKNAVIKANNKLYDINNLHYGQTITKEIDCDEESFNLNIELLFKNKHNNIHINKNIDLQFMYDPIISISQIKLNIINLLTLLIENDYHSELVNLVKSQIEDCNKLIEFYNLEDNDIIQNIMKDINGQILEGVSSKDFYNRWGENYFRSLRVAYLNEIKNNFKDFGIQHYGGKLFNKLLDEFEDIFINTEIKKTPRAFSRNSYQNNSKSISRTPPISASRYYDSSGGCFSGNCEVNTDNGIKLIKDLKKDDLVMTNKGFASVVCLVESIGNFETVQFITGLEITKYHPIYLSGWVFPINLKNTKITTHSIVYNLVLDKDHVVYINDILVCTLGHNITNNNVIKHDYFGTSKVIKDLEKLENYNNGKVIIYSNTTKRNEKGLVCQI